MFLYVVTGDVGRDLHETTTEDDTTEDDTTEDDSESLVQDDSEAESLVY